MAPIALPCIKVTFSGKSVHAIRQGPMMLQIETHGARIVLTISGGAIPELEFFLESEARSCKITDPDVAGGTFVVVFEMFLCKPMSESAVHFWSHANDLHLRVQLGMEFDKDYPGWSDNDYRLLFHTIKDIFVPTDWVVLTTKQTSQEAFDAVTGRDGEQNIIICKQRNVDLNVDSWSRLEDQRWLNDELINFGMQWALSKADHKISTSVRLMNTFLVEQLRRKGGLKAIEKWTMDVFEKTHIVIPVHTVNRDHWFLMVVENPAALLSDDDDETWIFILDSFSFPRKVEVDAVKRWLNHIAGIRLGKESKQDIQELFPSIPRQTNTYDCGLFTIQYALTIFSDPTTYCNAMRNRTHRTHNMWGEEEVPFLRSELRKGIASWALGDLLEYFAQSAA